MAVMGRPSIYSDELAAEICRRIVEGESLLAICRSEGMPCVSTIMKWRAAKPEFREQYLAAQLDRSDTHAEEALKIADDPDIPSDQKRIMVETRKWVATKQNPRKYGDRVMNELTGADGGPIQLRALDDKQLDAEIARLNELIPKEK
jgi:hypothetical protein